MLKLAAADAPEAEDLRREAALLASIPAAAARAAQLAPLIAHGEEAGWAWMLAQDVGGLQLDRLWARAGVGFRDVIEVGETSRARWPACTATAWCIAT